MARPGALITAAVVADQEEARRTKMQDWRRWLDDLDMTGVYKKWLQHDPDTIGPVRRELYERMTRRRRLWIARGYAGATKQNRSRPTGRSGPT